MMVTAASSSVPPNSATFFEHRIELLVRDPLQFDHPLREVFCGCSIQTLGRLLQILHTDRHSGLPGTQWRSTWGLDHAEILGRGLVVGPSDMDAVREKEE